MERSEYLKRPLIEEVEYEINNNRVKITCPHTCFIHIEREGEKVSLPEVERLFRDLRKAAKDTGKIKLKGVSKFLPTVRSLYPAYCAGNEQMRQLFSEISEIALKLKSDGIHVGCTDDELFQTAIKKQNEISHLHYRDTEYSRFRSYYRNLQNIVHNKEWQRDDVVSITIPLV